MIRYRSAIWTSAGRCGRPELEDAVAAAQMAMTEASEAVLDGFQIQTEAKVIRYPERYMDERGREMWTTVWEIMKELV